jgi:hypothetical protein
MNSTEHPDLQTLADFNAGRLADAEVEVVIAHLVECGLCLGTVDRLWDEIMTGIAGMAIPKLELERAVRIERDLWRRIQRSDLGGETVRLGTGLLLSVWLALLRPLFGPRRAWTMGRGER